ncbi:hypothetical protein JW756_01805 [Candidatus Woesearchaeota archaeon]|nr:hypothetical protein [Candidatus Woesearchaeota archaeon]
MKNKALLLGLVVLTVLMSAGIAAAWSYGGYGYGYGYEDYPVNPSISGRYYPYAQTPARVGGYYGQNSAFLIGLKPGVYTGPIWNGYTRQNLASAYYPRVGGFFGWRPYASYYSLRPGMFTFNGVGTNYASTPYVYGGIL